MFQNHAFRPARRPRQPADAVATCLAVVAATLLIVPAGLAQDLQLDLPAPQPASAAPADDRPRAPEPLAAPPAAADNAPLDDGAKPAAPRAAAGKATDKKAAEKKAAGKEGAKKDGKKDGKKEDQEEGKKKKEDFNDCCGRPGMIPVCRCVPVTKKKSHTEYDTKCELVCVPGCGLLHGHDTKCMAAGCTGVGCPSCADVRIRQRKTLLKRVTEKEYDTYEFKIEWVPARCAFGGCLDCGPGAHGGPFRGGFLDWLLSHE